MVKKNPFTTSSQEKNTLQKVDVSLSKCDVSLQSREEKKQIQRVHHKVQNKAR